MPNVNENRKETEEQKTRTYRITDNDGTALDVILVEENGWLRTFGDEYSDLYRGNLGIDLDIERFTHLSRAQRAEAVRSDIERLYRALTPEEKARFGLSCKPA